MQQPDYTSPSYYHQYPQPPSSAPTHHPPPPFSASAPPFSTPNYPPPTPPPQPATSDFSSFPSSYPSYPHDPLPTAPSYTSHPPPPPQQPQLAPQFPQFEFQAAYQPPPQSYPFYPSLDQPGPAPNYSTSDPNQNSAYPSFYPSQYPQLDQNLGLYNEASRKFGDHDRYGNDGVYAYQGSKVEPYGARGTALKSSTWSSFDDFGRPIGYSSNKDRSGSGSGAEGVKAVPKPETVNDVKGGV